MFVTKSSHNLIVELNRYKWKKDSGGNMLNQPVEVWNHALDAVRYIALNLLKVKPAVAYNISIVGNDGSIHRQAAGHSGLRTSIR